MVVHLLPKWSVPIGVFGEWVEVLTFALVVASFKFLHETTGRGYLTAQVAVFQSVDNIYWSPRWSGNAIHVCAKRL